MVRQSEMNDRCISLKPEIFQQHLICGITTTTCPIRCTWKYCFFKSFISSSTSNLGDDGILICCTDSPLGGTVFSKTFRQAIQKATLPRNDFVSKTRLVKKKKKHPTANGLNHTTWPAKGTLISFQDTPAKVLLIPLNLTRYQNWWFGSLTLVLTVRFDVSMRRFKQISGVSVLRIIFLSGYA